MRLASLLLVLSGCSDRPLDRPEELADLSVATDLASSRDLASADLQVINDLSAPLDLSHPNVRLLAPLSTSRVTSHSPTLHWSGSGHLSVELCHDRACNDVFDRIDSTGTSARPSHPLSPGVVFWRVVGGATPTPVWEFFVTARDAALDDSYGSTLDVNGDGFGDVTITTEGSTQWLALLFLGSASGIHPDQKMTLFGMTWMYGWYSPLRMGNLGDVNGDGFGDIGVSGFGPDPSPAQPVKVYLGGPSGPSSSPLYVDGPDPTLHFGSNLAGVGDVNGDGYGDFVVSTETHLGTNPQVCLFLGGPNGPGSRVCSALPAGNSGVEVLAPGDFNGDGYGDVIVGNTIFLGGPAGLGAPTLLAPPAGVACGAASADVDGDGFSDVLIAPCSSDSAYLYSGGPNGLAASPGVTIAWNHPIVPVLAAAGDLDGDGHEDLLLAGHFTGSGGGDGPMLYLGGPSRLVPVPAAADQVTGAGDVNGDHFDDVLVTGLYGNSAIIYSGSTGGALGPDMGAEGTIPQDDPNSTYTYLAGYL